ncbi:unnamed protein product [Peronospora belbahrii]|uniref:6-pyruvoyltetrahydropterin synthase n=1 Tax=Peronospora belbahrii TaxID=622444 RepID=A0AAU9L1G0_9STRA|nr:unnamed protein product [Peronospora belbahrii]CAH0520577.1 unnamed protein product [Peronospora belbahrii]
MLRERNTFVLRAHRNCSEERQHAFTLHVNIREKDLAHFNGGNGTEGAKALERLLEVLNNDNSFQALVREMDDLRQLDQFVKIKAKDGTHTLELLDVTVQWQVAEEPGLSNVLQRVQVSNDAAQKTAKKVDGRYHRLPVRKLVVAAWMYPPHVKIPPTGDQIPFSDVDKQDFFVEVENDNNIEESAHTE